jgi:hypothetical protein
MAKTINEPFPTEALDTNRAGRLGDLLLTRYRRVEWAARFARLGAALLCVALAAAVIYQGRTDAYAPVYYVVAAVLCVAAVGLAYVGLFYNDPLALDLRNGRVETVEGAIGKHLRRVTGAGDTMNNFYIVVAGRNFNVTADAYRAAPYAGWVRAYVLPLSRRAVNLERLPDKPVEDALASSGARAMATARLSAAVQAGDLVALNEARAEIAAMTTVMKDELSAAIVRPSPDELDPRPLAEAIVGTWKMGPASLTFRSDGSLLATLQGGRKQTGTWSVDKNGRLLSSATGDKVGADSWVAGDVLTIADGERGLTFKRVQAGPQD